MVVAISVNAIFFMMLIPLNFMLLSNSVLHFLLLAVSLRTASTWPSFFVLTGFFSIFLESFFDKFSQNDVNRFDFKTPKNLNFFLLKSPFALHISVSADAQRGLPRASCPTLSLNLKDIHHASF